MGIHVDINTCTDACTHSKQEVGTEMRGLQHQTMHRGGADMESQMDINSCTDAWKHSKQGV